jgi:hypothetical protein
MNKSFKARLEALEALEGPPAGGVLDNSPLTWEDRELLYIAISTHRAILDERGYLARKDGPSAPDDLDRAISRCNADLASLVPRLRTIEDVDAWIRDLSDPDAFDDDTVIAWAHWGLTKKADHENVLSFGSGALQVTAVFPGAVPRYWRRIAERAAPLLKERDIVLMPLLPEDARSALALLDSGVITCKPITGLYPWRSHHTTIQASYACDPTNVRIRLVHALDQAQCQTNGAFIETAEELRAVLTAGLEKIDYESVYEAIDRPRTG